MKYLIIILQLIFILVNVVAVAGGMYLIAHGAYLINQPIGEITTGVLLIAVAFLFDLTNDWKGVKNWKLETRSNVRLKTQHTYRRPITNHFWL